MTRQQWRKTSRYQTFESIGALELYNHIQEAHHGYLTREHRPEYQQKLMMHQKECEENDRRTK